MDATPVGTNLIPGISPMFLKMKERKGIKNSKEKINKLEINRFLAMVDRHVTAIAPTPIIAMMKSKNSRKSDTSEKAIALLDNPRTPLRDLAYIISIKIAPNITAISQEYNPIIRKRNFPLISLFYQKLF